MGSRCKSVLVFPSRFLGGLVVVCVMLQILITVPARAELPLLLTPAATRSTWMTADYLTKNQGRAFVENAMAEELIFRLHRINPKMPRLAAIRAEQTFRRGLNESPQFARAKTTQDRISAGLNVLEALAPDISFQLSAVFASAGVSVPTAWAPALVREVIQATSESYLDDLKYEDQVTLSDNLSDRAGEIHALFSVRMDHYVAACSQRGSNYCDNRNAAMLTSSGVDFGRPTDVIIEDNPVLAGLSGIRALISDSGAMRAELGELTRLSRIEFAKIMDGVKEIQGAMLRIDQQQADILAWIAKEDARRQAEKDAADLALKYDVRIQGARASVFLLSTLITGIDEEFGKSFQALGNTAIDLADSFIKFTETMARLGNIGDILGQTLATAALTGNVVGAVMNLISILDGRPTAEDLILQGIDDIKQQLVKLSEQMDSRFDRIDRGLASIYDRLNLGLEAIDTKLGEIKGSVDDILLNMSIGQADLQRLGRDMLTAISNAEGRDLWRAIDDVMTYRARSGGGQIPRDRFLTHESFFYTWATQFASDEIATGPDGRPTDDGLVAGELSGPLDRNVKYLGEYLLDKWPHLPSTGLERVVNPTQWALAAKAYAAAATEWPQHAALINHKRWENLLEPGRNVAARLAALSENDMLFVRLIENYRRKLESTDHWIEGEESALIRDLGLDPFRSQNQTPTIERPIQLGLAPPCRGDISGLRDLSLAPLDERALSLIRPQHRILRRIHDLTGGESLDQISWCWEGYVRSRVEGQDENGFPCVKARIAFSVWMKFRNEFNIGHTALTDDLSSAGQECNAGFGSGHITSSLAEWAWDPVRAPYIGLDRDIGQIYEDGDSEVVLASLRPDSVYRKIDWGEIGTFLFAKRQQFYSRMRNRFMLQLPSDPSRELTGAKTLLTAFVSLAFPQSLTENEALRAMLMGQQDLLDEQSLIAAYGDGLLRLEFNLRPDIMKQAEERLLLLDKTLQEYVRASRDGSITESHGLLTSALEHVVLGESLVRSSAEAPGAPLGYVVGGEIAVDEESQ